MEKLELLEQRRSVRAYSPESVPDEALGHLRAEVSYINSHEAGLRFQIITGDPEPFKDFDRSYGSFRNVRNYLAAVIDTASPDVRERAGYFAERFTIKAVGLGLGTCFIGGTYRKGSVKAQLRAGEQVLFVVAFGIPENKERMLARLTSKVFHMRRMAPRDFFNPVGEAEIAEDEFHFLPDGLKAIACAPSSLNKRPVRVELKEGFLRAFVQKETPESLVDLGIAKFNFNFATDTVCEWGNHAPLAEFKS